MSDQSAILSLPYILPSQAQKHVTHNEALRLLDLVVQLSVKDRDRTAPPAAPEAGDRHIVASGGSGDWAGQDGAVAHYAVGEGWVFTPPLPGWRAYVEAEAAMAVWDGSAWQSLAPEFQNLDGVGVNTGSDAVNRLAVASEASLFSHEGASHQVKVNKAAAADTASLLFQTGWSGRAEMGTAGNDDFSIKVSADGATWHTGLSVSGTSGVVTAPQGLSADSVTGLAVQQDPFDATPGRLMTSGAFGLGGTLAICPGDDLDQAPPGSFCRFGVSSINKPGPANSAGVVITSEWSSGVRSQISHLFYPAPYRNHVFTRVMDGGSWLPWRAQLGQLNLVGAVTQDAGIPTGAVIERDVNANGEYVRFADGTQICSHAVTVQSTGATVWNFPAGFGASPRVSATPNALDPRCVSVAGIGPSGGSFRVWDLGGSRVAASVEISAIGRWF